MAGGMTGRSGRPLQDRPVASASLNSDAGPTGPASCAVPCWVELADGRVEGVVLGWQQGAEGTWWALVSTWLPQQAVARRAVVRDP